jgi:hypothetical protein
VLKDKNEPILIKVSPEIGAMIDDACGGKTKGGRGHRGGRSWWVMTAVLEKLGQPVPENLIINEEEALRLDNVDIMRLDRKTQVILTCYRNGLTLDDIVEYLIVNKVPTSRGGQWNKVRVRNMLERAEQKALAVEY